MGARPTIFVVDDQPAVRDGLKEMLSVLGYQVETFHSAESFLAAFDPARPGCLVADFRMPGMDGLELIRQLASRKSQLPVILISGHADVPIAVTAIKAGAEDVIEKPINDVKLIAAINRSLVRVFEHLADQRSIDELRTRFGALTAREVEVYDLVSQGRTSQAIGLLLGISPRTVESYRTQIMSKMQASSVTDLVRQAIRLGRLTP